MKDLFSYYVAMFRLSVLGRTSISPLRRVLYDRHGCRADHLLGSVVVGCAIKRRQRGRLYGRDIRRVLHRVDVGA